MSAVFGEREKCRFWHEKRPATIFEKATVARKFVMVFCSLKFSEV